MFRVCHTVLSVHCSLMVTCWEMAYLLTLLYVIFSCVFVTFPCVVLGQVWYLIVSIPDLCFLPYFDSLVYFRLLDMIHVMTFDFHGSWESELAHNSPLYPRTNQLGDEYYNNVVSTQNYSIYVHYDKCSKLSNPCFLSKSHRQTAQKRSDQGIYCLLYSDKHFVNFGTYSFKKGDLAIRRIFSLVDMFTKP